MKKDTTSPFEASFFDLDIKIANKKFDLGFYDKSDSPSFPIVRMPYLWSNAPSKIFYASLGVEILRIGRTSIDFNKFKLSYETLISRMINQGAK